MSDFFFNLTPEPILAAVEQIGIRSTGRVSAMNSLENRVYDVELEDNPSLRVHDGTGRTGVTTVPADSHVVGKFYRPGRWSKETILEEHEFLADLAAAEVPVVCPLKLQNGSTVGTAEGEILFSVFPKARGRAPQELNDDQLTQLGRFIGRLHNVGATKAAPHRIHLTPEKYGVESLKFLIDNNWLPMELVSRYRAVTEEIIQTISPLFKDLKVHRLHGDCHMGNLLENKEGFFIIDFDDMLVGPAVQDIWLLTPGRDEEALRQRTIFLQGYTEMREFDRDQLQLVEPLRALRIVNYSAWVARRWKDPAFPRTFTEFNTHRYWDSEIRDLQIQLDFIKRQHSVV